MRLALAAFCAAMLAPALAAAADATDRSVAVLPMPGESIRAKEAAAQVWPIVVQLLQLDAGVRVTAIDAVARFDNEDPSAVEAADALGVRYVFVADVTGDDIYRFHCTLRDGRTGAPVWAHVLFTDDYNIGTFPNEVAMTLGMVLRELVP